MKSEIKIKVAAESWKNGGVFTAKAGNGRGGYYKGAKTYTVPKAVKFVVESFEDQGIVPIVSYEGEYAVITAEAA